MTELQVIILVIVGAVCFLAGRWKGIKDFDAAMVKAGKLPPHRNPDEL